MKLARHVPRTAVVAGAVVAAIGAAAAVSSARSSQQAPVYGASVEMVRLHVAVIDDDGPVSDLTAADFTVIDNGVPHPVAVALTPTASPIDVALVLDQSDSIRQGAPTVKRDARAFLDALGQDDCAFVLPFQHRVGPGVWGPSMAPTLLEIIDRLRLVGGTSMYDAVIVGLSEVQRWNVPAVLAQRIISEYEPPVIAGGVGISLGREVADEEPAAADDAPGLQTHDLPFRVFPSSFGCGGMFTAQADRRKAVVVLSDGVDTTSAHTFGELLGFVHRTDVPVFAVAIGHPGPGRPPSRNRELRDVAQLAERRMRTLAAATGGTYVVGDGSETSLRDAYEQIITILRGSYLLGFYPQSPSPEDTREHRVEVTLNRRDVEVFARSEYYHSVGDRHAARMALRRGVEGLLAEDLDAALLEARQAVAASADLGDAYLLEAAALWMRGDGAGAAAPLARALELAPGIAAAHFLAWQLAYERGDAPAAWRQLLWASIAGADIDAERELTAAQHPEPADFDLHVGARRVFVEGLRGDDPEVYERLAGVVGALARALSQTPHLGLVRDPLAADYFVSIDPGDPDRRRPRALRSRLELHNYANRRLWRGDLDVDDLDDAAAIEEAVAGAMQQLEEFLTEGR